MKRKKIYLLWFSNNGGVFVKVNDKIKSDSKLWLKNDKEITSHGDTLLFVNHSDIFREIFDIDAKNGNGFIGHLSSFQNINPLDTPDVFDKESLLRFEKGETESSKIYSINNRRYFSYMNPLYIEPECLKCHGVQDYKVGDVRGGICIHVPMDKYDTF